MCVTFFVTNSRKRVFRSWNLAQWDEIISEGVFSFPSTCPFYSLLRVSWSPDCLPPFLWILTENLELLGFFDINFALFLVIIFDAILDIIFKAVLTQWNIQIRKRINLSWHFKIIQIKNASSKNISLRCAQSGAN